MRSLAPIIRPYAELCKIRISFFAALSSSACFILASSGMTKALTMECIMISTGVFFLAAGSCALNHYQERETDGLMPRTSGRPIPSGRIRPEQAKAFSFLLMGLGSAVLLAFGGISAVLLGLFAALWYNGVYVLLKKKSAFSVIPGALTGMIPPAIGWSSGGGMPFSPVFCSLCLCFFIWQIPHSWLLFLEYGHEYEKAGLPSLTQLWSRRQIIRNTFIWTLCTAIICLTVSLHLTSIAPVIRVALVAAALWLAGSSALLFYHGKHGYAHSFLFGKLNAYMFVVMALMVCGRLIQRNIL